MANASESSGNSVSARATRTFSRAVCVSMPQAQLSQWAHRQRPLGGPDLAAVELGDEGKQPVRGGMDVGGEGGDGGGQRVVVHGGEIVCCDGIWSGHGVRKSQ